MKRQIKQSISLLFSALISFVLISSLFPSSALAADTIKVGGIMPMSGPLSIVGMTWTRGFEMIIEKYNEAGGININGKMYKVKLYSADTKGSPEASRASALKLVHRDKVDVMVGGILEPAIEAIYNVCEDAGIFYAANINIPGHPADISPDKPLQARLSTSMDDTHIIDLEFLTQTYPTVKTIAISAPEIGYDGMIAKFKQQASQYGLTVNAAEIWQWGVTDFIPVFTKVLYSKPDAILAMGSGQAQYQLMAAKQLGFDGVFISNSPLAPEVFLAVAGPRDCDKLIVNAPNTQDNRPEIKKVIARWKKNYREEFVGDSLYGYDTLWVLLQVIEKAQSLEGKKMMAALESMTNDFELVTTHGNAKVVGKERFGVNRTLTRPIALTHLRKGKIVDSKFLLP